MLLDERNRMKVACTRPWHFCIVALATISVISTSIFTLRPIPAARAEAPAREEGSLARRATQRLAKPAAKPTSDQRNDVPQSITITGVCLDENKRPLADVRLHLIEIDYNSRLQNELEELRSDAQGEFHFKPIPYDELDRQRYQLNQLILWVVARLPGKATAIRRLDASAIGAKNELTGFALDRQRTNYGTPADEKLQLTLPPAGTLRGQVKDASGQPVAGAAVSASYPMLKFISGVRNAVTDADGRYEISDLQCWDATKRDAHLEDAGYEAYPTQLYAGASCEGFATQGMLYNQVPGTMDITLHRPAKVEGQVVDSHNMPQAGASVSFTEAGGAATAAAETTDEHGHYSISTLPPGKYRVQTFCAERPSLIEQEVEIGPVATMHDIQLKAAGTIRGTLVDDATGKPIGTTDPANLSSMITVVYSDPSATSMFFSAADAEGKFSLPAPTGPGYLAIMNPGTQTYREIFEGGRRREYKTVDVKEEETLEIELRVGGELVDRDHGFPMMPRIPYDVPKKAEKADSRKSSSIEAQTEAMAQATPAESKAESKTSTDRTSVDRGVDIVVQRAGGQNKTTNGLPEELGPKIAKLRGVDRVMGGLLDMVSWHDDGVTGALLNGWPAACLLFERLKIQAGRTLAADDNRKIILGTELARQLKKKVGDKVELYGSAEFEVVGVFESPIVFENNGAVLPLKELQSLMNCPGMVTGFSIAAKRPIDEAGLKDLAHRIELFAASQQDASGARLEVDAKPVMDPAQRTAGARPSP